MTWLAFLFALEAGFQSQSVLLYTAPDWDPASLQAGYQIDSPYIQLEASGELFGFLRLGGSSQVYFADTAGWQYAPFDARFRFFFQARFYGFTVGWEHECFHPQESPNRPDVGFLFGGGDRIYVRYEGKIRVN